jgi:hypothetical protein
LELFLVGLSLGVALAHCGFCLGLGFQCFGQAPVLLLVLLVRG